MKTKILLMTLVMGLWMGLNQVQATPITIQIKGNVTVVAGTGRESIPDTIHAGVGFKGIYTYDSDALDSDPSDQNGIYPLNSPYGISVELGGYEFETVLNHTNGFEIQILNDSLNDWPCDYYTVLSSEVISSIPTDFEIRGIGWYLRDNTHTALSCDALLTTAPTLAEWDFNRFEITGVNSLNQTINIVGIVTNAIPEPLTGILMVMGVFFVRCKR